MNPKWFGDVIVRTQFQAHHLVYFFPFGREHNYRYQGILCPYSLAYVVTVFARHHHVQKHQVRGFLLKGVQGFIAVIRLNDLITFAFQGVC